ncbi:GNAT family N-acetyltransferase [Kineosporia sp. NBRC 101731]|uniref:GNAT family N-acetyltransferase n=1 Tax=Kineosporia sp. NBRC 101731 TaxID=3032199 RepID=UPI0024A435AD|nr:GNAT family N-acetyltransferase [Kineosporia sp. NBRC 101731]GLY33460.1 hypothetical protein Kisp02_68250 [Kineosporia sp. NBRC 101731]
MTDFETAVGQEAGRLRSELTAVYQAAFRLPPYDKTEADVEANFARFDRQITRPGFRAVLTHADDGTPTGMAYGHTLSASTGWWKTMTDPVDEETTREDGARTFGLFELAVHPEHQRQGLATAIHHALINDLTHERVILNARPDATAAMSAYASWGYRKIGQNIPWDGAAPHVVLLLELPSGP